MSTVLESSAEAAYEALKRRDWEGAFQLFGQLDQESLTAPDLSAYGDAAWWSGHPEVALDAFERAFSAAVRDKNNLLAALMAIRLASENGSRQLFTAADAWMQRAETILAKDPDSPAQGFLIETKAIFAMVTGRLEDAASGAEQMIELGERLEEPSITAMGWHLKGRILVAHGNVEEGLRFMDKATAGAMTGELDLYTAGSIYCSTISACAGLSDYRRAAEWTESSKRFLEREHITGFPGLCRVHRAEIMKVQGSWPEAEMQARQACEELEKYFKGAVAWGTYEIGEIRLRMGDLDEAEKNFRITHEFGEVPHPGLALLMHARGKTEAAARMLDAALDDESAPPSFVRIPGTGLTKSKLLPARIEIALIQNDLDTARARCAELNSLAEMYGSGALHAAAEHARGSVQHAEGDHAEAVRSLKKAVKIWREVDAPYETAKSRLAMARALRALGDEEEAVLEAESAQSRFEQLKARADLKAANDFLAEGPDVRGERRVVKTFMFTDIVKSTNLAEAMGDEAWNDLIHWHDQMLRGLFSQCEGEVVKTIGDGFFVAFDDAKNAIDAGVLIQKKLVEHRKNAGFAPQVRIGVHVAEATQKGIDYAGGGVNAAARIGALADGGDLLVSIEATEAAGNPYPTTDARDVELKGISHPVKVALIDWK